jgi:hypothetical protein
MKTMNGRYHSVQRMKINWDDVFTTPIPYPIELTPQEEIIRLESLIADEQETIRAFGSSRIALDAKANVKHLEDEREQWLAVVYAAEQEAFDRARKARAVYPKFDERRAWFIGLVQERIGR